MKNALNPKMLAAMQASQQAVTLPRDYFRPPAAAYYLDVSQRTLIRLTNSGAIACAKLGKKLTLYKRGDLDAFFQRNRRKAISEVKS